MSHRTDPVVVSLNVEGFGSRREYTFEVPRDEWDAMTAKERQDLLDELADGHAHQFVSWGWHIDDADDYAETEG